MKLDNIFVTGADEDALIELTKKYNEEHPEDRITFQEFAEKALHEALLSLTVSLPGFKV